MTSLPPSASRTGPDEAATLPARPVRGRTADVRILAVDGEESRRRRDRLATEEPLEIRVGTGGDPATSVAVTMRTPGNDFELAAGFLLTEGVVAAPQEIESIAYCRDVPSAEQEFNVVTVRVRHPVDLEALRRNVFTSSSCGVCGKATIDGLTVRCAPVSAGPQVDRATIEALPDTLRAAQRLFDQTGGIHATGLFDADGSLQVLREDVGRHNAMDKVVGNRLLAGAVPLDGSIALVSGRLSFELVQKAAVAGIPIVCAVSAPSSLAVDTARRLGLTLVGFLRGDRFNVYTGPERIELAPSGVSG